MIYINLAFKYNKDDARRLVRHYFYFVRKKALCDYYTACSKGRIKSQSSKIRYFSFLDDYAQYWRIHRLGSYYRIIHSRRVDPQRKNRILGKPDGFIYAARGSREHTDQLVTSFTGIEPDHPLFPALSEVFANV